MIPILCCPNCNSNKIIKIKKTVEKTYISLNEDGDVLYGSSGEYIDSVEYRCIDCYFTSKWINRFILKIGE